MTKKEKLSGTELAFKAALTIELLRNTTETMTWKKYATRIGLLGGNGWKPWHRQQTALIVNAAYALNQAAETPELPPEAFKRFRDRNGKLGDGYYNEVALVITKPTDE